MKKKILHYTHSKTKLESNRMPTLKSATDFNRPVSLRGLFGGRIGTASKQASCPFQKLTLEKGFLTKGQEEVALLKRYLGCVPRVTIRLTGGRIRALPYT